MSEGYNISAPPTAPSLESINTELPMKSSTNKPKTNGMIGTIFIVLSILLCVIYLISVLARKQMSDGIKITTIICWLIFGIFFSYVILKNNNVRMNVGISFFVILISCLLTCRQINAIKTCMI